ncbi:MAG: hypothetical protein ACFNUH_07420, partial [Bacteroidota bacterium]
TSCEGTKFSVDVKLSFRSIKSRTFSSAYFLLDLGAKIAKGKENIPALYACTLKKVCGWLLDSYNRNC